MCSSSHLQTVTLKSLNLNSGLPIVSPSEEIASSSVLALFLSQKMAKGNSLKIAR
ncbi:hypothetical protein VCRA2114E365_250036 [Vibrio crassostreae]|nr:hypothetical protein VCRA2113O222_220043 [Vibrio crassostreae]CAK1905833.1 hypothetical protein VCRA2113O221_220043 [Vibrio crassostreae]CAK1906626.1 hypothetical protein VCRA2119O245_220043 [Vibrio crassostreae]CAK1910383.1 hypothetical protein VCRA2113O207_240038 [Vibrio crassostreae]CAK1914106.1 hypothetical protein VCRA2113O324_210045 [Vibrio crassostreae]